jgi:hypothetical protein
VRLPTLGLLLTALTVLLGIVAFPVPLTSPTLAASKPTPTYDRHVGNDEATFEAIRTLIMDSDNRLADAILRTNQRIDRNNERIADHETQLREMHEWRSAVTRGLWEIMLLIIGALVTLFFGAFRLQQSYKLLSAGYEKINDNHRLLHERFSAWDGRERRGGE